MPFVKVLKRFGPGDAMRVSFLVSSAVGRGQANRREDTLLVQFFLNRLWSRAEKGQTYGIPGKPPLAIDGVCGSNTIAAIQRFQTLFYGAHGDVVIHDGVVHPALPGHSSGARHQQLYTILALNLMFAEEYGKERHMLMANEPNFPNELLYLFYS